ncbi:hypothetical protein T03_712 [Trichinella britovi]|uniref:Uncharacterized protein n=1 Tax=Trichinella britovi TaxID=45882 RepID=A0A0V1DFU3_TRIBR|nr:hypothetical protein T03_712 [Trichinella britovi]
MQADRNPTNIRSFYSASNNQRNVLRRQQRTESQCTTGRNNSTRNRWLLKTSVSSTNFDGFTDVNVGAPMVIWRARPSGGFFKYFIDAQLTQWRKQPLSNAQRTSANVSARGLSDPCLCRQMLR